MIVYCVIGAAAFIAGGILFLRYLERLGDGNQLMPPEFLERQQKDDE